MNHRQFDHVDSAHAGVRERSFNSIKTRRGLPENTVYEDTGCDLAPSCLECPLALCKYDDPNRARYDRTVMRNTEVMRLFAEGLKVSAIALKVKISSRTVYRIIQRELGSADDASGIRVKHASRGRALRERVSEDRLESWRQYSMPEVSGFGGGLGSEGLLCDRAA